VPSTATPFEVHESGAYLHGTKADLAVGALLVPGRESNVEAERIMNHVYVTQTLDAAVWGAELAAGDGPGHVYFVEPQGPGGGRPERDGQETARQSDALLPHARAGEDRRRIDRLDRSLP
jgi:hypothetical protein